MLIIYKTDNENATCEKCKKPNAPDNPIVAISVQVRRHYENSYIEIHVKCLQRGLDKAIELR